MKLEHFSVCLVIEEIDLYECNILFHRRKLSNERVLLKGKGSEVVLRVVGLWGLLFKLKRAGTLD
jgi:hypothetical protein